jgi:hypothetical protein
MRLFLSTQCASTDKPKKNSQQIQAAHWETPGIRPAQSGTAIITQTFQNKYELVH